MDFLAVLVFQTPDDRRDLLSRRFTASHPEIAYLQAITTGVDFQFGDAFLGLTELAVETPEFSYLDLSHIQKGPRIPTAKNELTAFSDPRWINSPPDRNALTSADVAEVAIPELLGIEQIHWGRLSHAYGSARDVPSDLRDIASPDPSVHKCALWRLSSTIYHQGDVFDSTAAAIPFLVSLASHSGVETRSTIADFLGAISASANASQEKVRLAWEYRKKLSGEIFLRPAAMMAEWQISNNELVRRAFTESHIDDRMLAQINDAAFKETSSHRSEIEVDDC